MKVGELRIGDWFRMWDKGPILQVIEPRGPRTLVQRGDLVFTRQEIPSDTKVVCEYARDSTSIPLTDALSQSPFKKIREIRVITPEEG